MNNRLEIGGFQAYNETFVDDNGLEMCREPYVDIREETLTRNVPKCRRSIANPSIRHYDFAKRGLEFHQLAVGFHKDGYVVPLQDIPFRYESDGEASCSTTPKKDSTRDCNDSVDALYRRYEEIESANEEYVDYPEDRMGFRSDLSIRESPLGCSGPYKTETPVSTPKKSVSLKLTPSKTPTKLSRRNTVVLAPMIAHVEKQRSLHRSRSTILSSPRRPILARSPGKSSTMLPTHIFQQAQLHRQNINLGKSMPNVVVPRYHTPIRLPSFNHLFESELIDPALERMISPNRKPNTAVITPNMRSSIAPLLPTTPPHETSPQPPVKSPSNYSKVSWATLPTIHLPIETLCFFGFIMLTAGAATTILCFYLLSIAGKRYFLNFGAVAGFASLILGLLSCRTNKWRWLPHRNYLTGYILLGTFSLLNAACLGGIFYAIEVQSHALLDTLGGAVCGVSVLLIIGSVIGMITSGCCHRPPPDNRVAHCVTGFTV
ncbi:uncharacterized protein LOC106664441 [Cimex lectularius]|uniref:Sanpodo n=1 Tax=Cimex lectularius TaxID=79782 RepID=A0A8I6SSG3_CIMLE|nr:uncharacterized protein LOC106664441 [Cimex lectularius]